MPTESSIALSNPSILETLNRSGRAWRVRDLARLLNVASPTIYAWVRLGKLPAMRPGAGRVIRFDGPSVARALKGGKSTSD